MSKIKELSKLLNEEAIAEAFNLTPEAVRDIIEGKAEVEKIERPQGSGTIIQVSSVKTAYRQKVISVCRSKGGVGCTLVALGLTYLLSRELRSLLIDLSFPWGKGLPWGPGDLSCYLGLPEYPHMGIFRGVLEECVIELEPNFHVLQPPHERVDDLPGAGQLIGLARQDYDAVVLDLPNSCGNQVEEALRHSTTLVMVTTGLESELVRLAALAGRFRHKELFIVANMCELPPEAEEAFTGVRVFHLERDGTLLRTLLGGDLPEMKSPFMCGLSRVKDALFEREKVGVLQQLKRRLFG